MRTKGQDLGPVVASTCPHCGSTSHILGWNRDDELVLECEYWLCRYRFAAVLDLPSRPRPMRTFSMRRPYPRTSPITIGRTRFTQRPMPMIAR